MRTTTHILLAITAAAALTATSCKSTQGIQPTATGTTAATAASPLQPYTNFGAWSTLSASGRVQISAGKQQISSSMQLKMTRDQQISISIRPLLGIEMAKLIITGDTLTILDRYHKIYVQEQISLLTASVPVNIATLQDILLGRAFIVGQGTMQASMDRQVSIEHGDAGTLITPHEQIAGFSYSFGFDNDCHITSLQITPAAGSTIYSVAYGNVLSTVAGNVASTAQISTTISKQPTQLTLQLNKTNWNTSIQDNTDIPADYRRASGESILKALGGTVK